MKKIVLSVAALSAALYKAAEILSKDDVPRSRREYITAYHNTLQAVRDALEGQGYESPPWTEGRNGRDRYQGMMDALADAEAMGVQIYMASYGSVSCSSGAHEAADPANWKGWPVNLLITDAPYREMYKAGFRPTECELAARVAHWVSGNPGRRAHCVPAIHGHYGQCSYLSVFVG